MLTSCGLRGGEAKFRGVATVAIAMAPSFSKARARFEPKQVLRQNPSGRFHASSQQVPEEDSKHTHGHELNARRRDTHDPNMQHVRPEKPRAGGAPRQGDALREMQDPARTGGGTY